ncbi:DNA polymerase III subunit epsilon [Anaplasma marginale str. Dawn]|uniref:DNA polymerase III subunit epsilon n=2 Tax=Anaplasma marginale TaxID=770 RepID=B9KIL2_ANAMF|nr:DNA polymerase III subunit epsilon [Anaplasma marginale]AAV86619.1 DNA polymerase III epsilon chain [Anaplasma marginale str. St. Maries]ACM49324.1 DNA polymerase III, epsilon chain (dnaQ) [Anaplasma marginale str. Florida]AGZ78860.1 DNA polymerase III subunit epsilon [Anaplasma marginale str. Gypsy Plains]AGZ79689.1 DNA polymerase III subunit epsilon [Anaplasma marginale str. Dawn]AXW84060.1 DNA polymerase III subunit epsilon [Anaplasma marginale]
MRTREIVLDTETTGLDAASGDRIIEIGCVELVDFVMTGQVFHKYINPERDIPIAATKIHGITTDMVKNMPKFAEMADQFLNFVQDSVLVIHNAGFDLKFIETEMERIGKTKLYNPVVDTLEVARRKFPGMPASLDALCKRFDISTSSRRFHGALKDATLLARVYVELCGGIQRSLGFVSGDLTQSTRASKASKPVLQAPRAFTISDLELKLHAESISKMKDPIWNMYLKTSD